MFIGETRKSHPGCFLALEFLRRAFFGRHDMVKKNENRVLKLSCYLVLITVIVVELFVAVWSQSRCIGIGYEILKAKKTGEEIKRRKKSFEAELGYLKSPHRILAIGQEKMGLKIPTLDNVVVVPDGDQKKQH